MSEISEKNDNPPEEPNSAHLLAITDPESPLLAGYQDLLSKTFPPEELDSIETTANGLRANLNPNRRSDLVIIVKTNEDGKVIAAINASHIPAKDEAGKRLGWGSVNINYVVTDPELRGKGIGAGLYPELNKKCRELAAAAGETIRFVVGETVNDVETLVNRTGRSRLYFEREGALVEVQYEQAPLEWDEEGNPDTEEVPLHLMATPTDGGKTITTEDLMRVVEGIYDENSRENARGICSEGGFKKACEVVAKVATKLKTQLKGVKEVRLISKTERETMQNQGVHFYEHQVEA